ncbi:MAG: zinc-binding dehydrogenase [Beijerinckiaceae bacterium]
MNADGSRAFLSLPEIEPAPGGVCIKMQAAPVLSYMRQVLDGTLVYALPQRPFIPGTNGIGVVAKMGAGVYHLAIGDRVLLDPRTIVDERVAAPAQILIGLTAMGRAGTGAADAAVLGLQAQWRNGTYSEVAHMPASVLTPLPRALDPIPAQRLAALSKFAVPYGGLLKGRLAAGECLIINGATGYFGSAAVLLGLAMGAAQVVAAGRDRQALAALATAGGPRVTTVALTGDSDADARALREAAGGGADLALDIVGRAESASATQATLHALRRGGRLVLMGSVKEPLPLLVGEMLANDWEVMGCFMYPKEAPAQLAAMAACGLLDLAKINVHAFPLRDLEAALEAASRMRGLDLTAVTMGQG